MLTDILERDSMFSLNSNAYPKQDPMPEEVDAVLAKQMTKLSVRERENIYFDLHGVHNTVEEPESLLEEKLKELRHELSQIREKQAYDFASAQSRAYTEDRNFRLCFLRAENWNPAKTALRLTRHFKMKLELFGADLITSEITQSDLTEDDLALLYSGYVQNLPFRDASGRSVIVTCPRRGAGHCANSKVSGKLIV